MSLDVSRDFQHTNALEPSTVILTTCKLLMLYCSIEIVKSISHMLQETNIGWIKCELRRSKESLSVLATSRTKTRTEFLRNYYDVTGKRGLLPDVAKLHDDLIACVKE